MNNFNIIGIAVETTNKDSKAAADLGKLWQEFYAQEVFNKIPNKVSEDVIAVYTDYESDYTGKYTAIIGQRVSSLDDIPEGLLGREIKNEHSEKYTAKGEMPAAVVTTWQGIWTNDGILNRSYKADFEVYGEKSQLGPDSEVEIYIGVWY